MPVHSVPRPRHIPPAQRLATPAFPWVEQGAGVAVGGTPTTADIVL